MAAQLASRDAAAGMHRLTMDADNVRAALHWCLAHDPAAGLRLATTFAQWCEARGYASEGHRWLVELLAHARAAPLADRAHALLWAALTVWRQGQQGPGYKLVNKSLALYRQLGDELGVAWATHTLGLLAWSDGAYARARAHWEESLALARTLGNSWGAQSLVATVLLRTDWRRPKPSGTNVGARTHWGTSACWPWTQASIRKHAGAWCIAWC